MVTRWLRQRLTREDGISLIDQLATLAIIATVCGIAVPALKNSVENQRLGIETRNVEREMQLARLSAVSSNRPVRVRFNCPSAKYYRRVELLGSVNSPISGDDADAQAAARCNQANYPYPAPDRDPLTRPSNDGPLQQLNTAVSFGATQTLEFWPNGTVHTTTGAVANSWLPILGSTGATITLTKGTATKTITVNSLGKIQIQ